MAPMPPISMKILVTALRIVKFALMGVRVCSCFLAANKKSLVLRVQRYYREWFTDSMALNHADLKDAL